MYSSAQAAFVCDRRNLAIHIEEFAFIKAEALNDILEGVRMHGLLKSLAQQILAAFGVGEMPVNCQHDVVGDERF